MKKMSLMLGLTAAMFSMPTFGSDNDLKSRFKAKPGKQIAADGSKPSNRRLKTKLARKANLKNRK